MKTIKSVLEERLKFGLEPTPEGSTYNSGDGSYLDVLLNDIEAIIKEQVLQALREDRKANTEFWKAKIDKLFDDEISIYTEALKALGRGEK